MSFHIRRAVPEDACTLAACHTACWQAAYQGIVPDEHLQHMPAALPQRTERFKQAIENGAHNYVPTCNNQIIGNLIFGESRDDDKPGVGEIGGFYLLPAYWDKGYGRQMMDFSIETLQNMGYNEIILWVFEKNARARQFYEKCGFILDGAQKEVTLGGRPLTEVRYGRRLS